MVYFKCTISKNATNELCTMKSFLEVMCKHGTYQYNYYLRYYTGINYYHTEFDNNRAKYSGIDTIDALRNQNKKGLDCQGHGTHVAGLAGGKTHGVAKNSTLYSVRVLDCNGRGPISAIVLGLNHVIKQVQKKQRSSKKTKAIINMSLTVKNTSTSRLMRDTITSAINNGILVVAAAGNYDSDACQ